MIFFISSLIKISLNVNIILKLMLFKSIGIKKFYLVEDN